MSEKIEDERGTADTPSGKGSTLKPLAYHYARADYDDDDNMQDEKRWSEDRTFLPTNGHLLNKVRSRKGKVRNKLTKSSTEEGLSYGECVPFEVWVLMRGHWAARVGIPGLFRNDRPIVRCRLLNYLCVARPAISVMAANVLFLYLPIAARTRTLHSAGERPQPLKSAF